MTDHRHEWVSRMHRSSSPDASHTGCCHPVAQRRDLHFNPRTHPNVVGHRLTSIRASANPPGGRDRWHRSAEHAHMQIPPRRYRMTVSLRDDGDRISGSDRQRYCAPAGPAGAAGAPGAGKASGVGGGILIGVTSASLSPSDHLMACRYISWIFGLSHVAGACAKVA
jgi:hypothetical protein